MSADELEAKIIAIKKRGLNIMVEQDLIRQLRAEYFTEKIQNRVERISNQFARNIEFLSRMFKDHITNNKVRLQMGINLVGDEDKIFRGEHKIYSLRIALIAAEYYGLPVELLLFHDLQADEQLFTQQYPTLIRQNRD